MPDQKGVGPAIAGLVAGLLSSVDVVTFLWMAQHHEALGWWKWPMYFAVVTSAFGFGSTSGKLLRSYLSPEALTDA